MPARNANDTTWYTLRYVTDFVPATSRPWPAEPLVAGGAAYDVDRQVLELVAAAPASPAEVPAATAVDVDGTTYFARGREVIVRRCDGSECPLVCERDVLAQPLGLALDRRGLLYVADRLARRVTVIDPEDGGVVGVLVDDLQEPVDVAVDMRGRIHVADRERGEIAVFDPRFQRRDTIAVVDETGARRRPIAAMIGDDGAVLVADETAPRLFRYVGGALTGDVPLLLDAEPTPSSRFVVGACPPHDDASRWLVAMHRRARARALRLSRSFETSGTFTSRALDGGLPGTTWHAIEIDADLPEGTELRIETKTADDVVSLAAASFAPAGNTARMRPGDPADRLVFSGRGRFLVVRLVLSGEARATPSVRALRVFYPRMSYLDLLPRIFRRDPESEVFLEHFLALFERIFTRVEDRYELFSRQLDPFAAPPDVVVWLAGLVDLVFDPSWPLEKRRALLAEAVDLYEIRGTPRGIARVIEIYTGSAPTILEGFLERPRAATWLGARGSILGSQTVLVPPVQRALRAAGEDDGFAHRFTVVLGVAEACDHDALLGAVSRILETHKPAHTVYRVRIVGPSDVRVGDVQVGIDVVLAGRTMPRVRLGGCDDGPADAAPPSLLGRGAVLGRTRPHPRAFETKL